ncbi:MAG: SAM-dependent methyltransferase, partial [Myxococcota bacterium]
GSDQTKDLWPFVPVKGAWNVWKRDKATKAVTIYAAWGERDLTRHALTPAETEVWDAIDGETQLSDLAETFDKEVVRGLVVKLAHHDVQALKLSAVKSSFYKGRQHMKPPYLASTMPYASYDPATDTMPAAIEDIFSPEGYYKAEIDDADEQFDHQETTLSHLFRKPHPALKNRTYGAALIDALGERGSLPESGAIKVLEIGGGLGFMAKAACEALQARGLDVTYEIMELAPTLAAAQKERCAGLPITIHMGDCLSSDFPSTGYDLILSNEMVGDLTAVKLTKDQVGLGGEEEIDDDVFEEALAATGLAGELVKRYKVPIGDAPDPFYLNIGAWHLVDRIAGILKPGGTAVVTEFGEMARYPVLSTQLDHPELSIHFGQMMLVAREVGLEADFAFVMDLIGMNRDMKGFATTRSYFRALKALLAEHGIALEKIGYTKSMFQALLGDELRVGKTIGEFDFDRIEDRLMGLVPHEFKALILTKPSA